MDHTSLPDAQKSQTNHVRDLFKKYQFDVANPNFEEGGKIEIALVKAATQEEVNKRANGSDSQTLFEELTAQKEAIEDYNSKLPLLAKGEALIREQKKAEAEGTELPQKRSFPYATLLKEIECSIEQYDMRAEVTNNAKFSRHNSALKNALDGGDTKKAGEIISDMLEPERKAFELEQAAAKVTAIQNEGHVISPATRNGPLY